MPTDQVDNKTAPETEPEEVKVALDQRVPLPPRPGLEANADALLHEELELHEPEGSSEAPSQLGHTRFVYAAYFAGGIAVAFLCSKVGTAIWQRLSAWKPQLGEPREDMLMPVSALVGIGVALYYWKFTRARQIAEEVASELSKVTWPSRKEVTNSTAVVIFTTAFGTVFFALMDQFWKFVTNLVYGT